MGVDEIGWDVVGRRGEARVPRAAVVDALVGAKGGVRRGHRVDRDTTRAGVTNLGEWRSAESESHSYEDVVSRGNPENRDAPREKSGF